MEGETNNTPESYETAFVKNLEATKSEDNQILDGPHKRKIGIATFSIRYKLVKHEQLHKERMRNKTDNHLKEYNSTKEWTDAGEKCYADKTESHRKDVAKVQSVGEAITNSVSKDSSPSQSLSDKLEPSLSVEEPVVSKLYDNNQAKNAEISLEKQLHNLGKHQPYVDFGRSTLSIRDQLEVLERLQKADKPYWCSYCDKGFKQKGHLMAHERTHTGEKPFKCDKCDKRFTKNTHLSVHNQSAHIREKRFICSTCDKGFVQKCELVSHERVHTGEKPFQCEICFKRFPRKCSLTRHQMSHTGEAGFKCDKCGRIFALERNLNLHKETKHSGENSPVIENNILIKQK